MQKWPQIAQKKSFSKKSIFRKPFVVIFLSF